MAQQQMQEPLTETEKEILLFEKKVKRLAKAGPGAGIACAAASVRLRELKDRAAQENQS